MKRKLIILTVLATVLLASGCASTSTPAPTNGSPTQVNNNIYVSSTGTGGSAQSSATGGDADSGAAASSSANLSSNQGQISGQRVNQIQESDQKSVNKPIKKAPNKGQAGKNIHKNVNPGSTDSSSTSTSSNAEAGASKVESEKGDTTVNITIINAAISDSGTEKTGSVVKTEKNNSVSQDIDEASKTINSNATPENKALE